MSRIFVCFFVFIILNIAVRFGDCEDNTIQPECDKNVTLGSDKTRLSIFEKMKELPTNLINKNKKSGRSSYKMPELSMIFPGTKWCGDGDVAHDEDDLGRLKKTDVCCRAHDNCKNYILAGEKLANLHNNGFFTRSACICDDQFYNCLKNASSPIISVAAGIGKTYFNMLQPQCFRCVCPGNCDLKNSISECKGNCTKYEWVNSRHF